MMCQWWVVSEFIMCQSSVLLLVFVCMLTSCSGRPSSPTINKAFAATAVRQCRCHSITRAILSHNSAVADNVGILHQSTTWTTHPSSVVAGGRQPEWTRWRWMGCRPCFGWQRNWWFQFAGAHTTSQICCDPLSSSSEETSNQFCCNSLSCSGKENSNLPKKRESTHDREGCFAKKFYTTGKQWEKQLVKLRLHYRARS